MNAPYTLINAHRNYEAGSTDPDVGLLLRDETIASRCRARLCTRRGEWIGDLAFGSQLHTIKTLKNAPDLAMTYIREALDTLIQAGEIVNLEPLEFVEDSSTGSLGVSVSVVLPSGSVMPLGIIPIGA